MIKKNMKKYKKFLVVISHLKISVKIRCQKQPNWFFSLSLTFFVFILAHSLKRIFIIVWTFWGQENLVERKKMLFKKIFLVC